LVTNPILLLAHAPYPDLGHRDVAINDWIRSANAIDCAGGTSSPFGGAGQHRIDLIDLSEAVAKLAKYRDIKPTNVHQVRDDLEIRPLLDTIIRRWTKLVPTEFITPAAARARRAKLHREHIVPCRVLVDRMIMNPSECRALLGRAVVIAWVAEAEHERLRFRFVDVEPLYGRMLKASVGRLSKLGMERYINTGIDLQST
jgi:hypothetical protein